jgi:predicted methyltransferase
MPTANWVILPAVAVLALSACATPSGQVPQAFSALLADPGRPAADVTRDADRRPGELMRFAGVRAGQKIAELAPGGGYFTRLLASAVGASGRVYAVAGRPSPALTELSTNRPNLAILAAGSGTIPVPEPVDIVWTTLNYHDFKNSKLPNGDAAKAANTEAFRVLKPGGTYLVVDHQGAPGTGASQTSTLHRIEDVQVVREVEAAGFRLEKQSDLLRHPADTHTLKVQETGIRGKTDQFVLKFRKPG